MEVGKIALDFSMRAIDAYKKTLLVDKVTSDDERPPPAYILDEISNILMSSSLELTQEIVEYTFRRLRHRSPEVKKKVLRFIKYTVNKAGSSAYRRELQSHSIAIRELVHYQGQVDPLKGNAPNQAVRDAAQEAIKAIFSSDVSFKGKIKQIEGFGNGSFSKPSTTSDRNSGYDEMGRESLLRCSGSGIFDHCNSNGSFEYRNGNGSFEYHNNNGSFESTNCKQENVEREGFHRCDSTVNFESENCKQHKKQNGELSRQSQGRNFCMQSEKVASREDRLLNNVTAPIGSRLRPTEESLQSFLSSAKTLNAVRISDALKAKLQSPSWQVRLKAVCVLRAILLRKDANLLQEIEAGEGDFHGFVQECLQSPQTTLRREAKEALNFLLALKEEKIHGKTVNDLVDDPSCDKPFFKTESDKELHKCAGSLKATPAVKSQYEVVDLLSFEMGDLTCGQAADSSPNSAVMDDPFDGMCMYGSNDKAAIHVKDLLSDGWVSSHTETPFENWPHVENAKLSTVSLQSSAVQQRQHDVFSLLDLTANMSYSTGKCAASTLDGKSHSQSPRALSNGNMPGLHNLAALYMPPNGAVGSLHIN